MPNGRNFPRCFFGMRTCRTARGRFRGLPRRQPAPRRAVHPHRAGADTRDWTVVLPMIANGGGMFEYACHEGNYGMEGILAGHRAEELANQ